MARKKEWRRWSTVAARVQKFEECNCTCWVCGCILVSWWNCVPGIARSKSEGCIFCCLELCIRLCKVLWRCIRLCKVLRQCIFICKVLCPSKSLCKVLGLCISSCKTLYLCIRSCMHSSDAFLNRLHSFEVYLLLEC